MKFLYLTNHISPISKIFFYPANSYLCCSLPSLSDYIISLCVFRGGLYVHVLVHMPVQIHTGATGEHQMVSSNPYLSFEACSLPEPGSCGFVVVCLFFLTPTTLCPYSAEITGMYEITSDLLCGCWGSNSGTNGCTTNAFIY